MRQTLSVPYDGNRSNETLKAECPVSEAVTQQVAEACNFLTFARHVPAAGKTNRLLHDRDTDGVLRE